MPLVQSAWPPFAADFVAIGIEVVWVATFDNRHLMPDLRAIHVCPHWHAR